MEASFLYIDDSMVAFTDLGWLHTAFDILKGLFDQVGVKTNVRKTVGMVCHPYQADGVWAYKAYTWRITVVGRNYKERHQEGVICPEYGKDLSRGSLSAHCQTQNDVVKGGPGQEGDIEGRGDNPRTYRMLFPEKVGLKPFPVEGCSGRVATRMDMQVHFWHWNVRDTVVILEEGNLSHP